MMLTVAPTHVCQPRTAGMQVPYSKQVPLGAAIAKRRAYQHVTSMHCVQGSGKCRMHECAGLCAKADVLPKAAIAHTPHSSATASLPKPTGAKSYPMMHDLYTSPMLLNASYGRKVSRCT